MDPGCPEGVHPAKAFSRPTAVAIDPHGNMYVASFGQKVDGSEGRVDIFNAKGVFISEVSVSTGPKNIAVDSKGNLYVANNAGQVLLYVPVPPYEPAAGEIKYSSSSKIIEEAKFAIFIGVAVNPLNDHIFIYQGSRIKEYGSASEGNSFIEAIEKGIGGTPVPTGLAIDAAHGRIYANDLEGPPGEQKSVVKGFELASPHKLVGTFDGSSTSSGSFIGNRLSIAADEETGNVFVYDGNGAEIVYELSQAGEYLATIDHEMKGHYVEGAEIEVDNGEQSPNGALNSFGRYLFIPAYPTNPGHVFAFGPQESCPPEIKETSVTGVTESEAKLRARINACNLETNYVFEYTTQQSFEEEGFAGASVAGEGQLAAKFAAVEVVAIAQELSPGTAYRFRVVAVNELDEREAEGEFSTYLAAEPPPPCSNDALRTGPSALLPDCRAYELVTPANTNARTPNGVGHLGTYFTTREASPAGDKVSFELLGGSLPGEGTGSYAGDPYLAARGENGWSSSYAGPAGLESPSLLPGSNSPDQGYSLWTANGAGSAAIEGEQTNYVRYPDGHSALVGRGSLGTDPRAIGRLISEGGGHIIFGTTSSPVQLEENAPSSGTRAIYDRTSDEVTHVVSLLPGGVTPAAGENAFYQGSSLDGRGIAFKLGGVTPNPALYLRYNDEETYEVAKEGTFAGVAEGGKRIFYLEGGDLYAFDVESEEAIRFTESGDVTVVNVASDGTAAYFVSPSVLTGEANPNGATPQAGKENLYRSREGVVSFVGTVTERDVAGENNGKELAGGLGLWATAVGTGAFGTRSPGNLGVDPSRTTPDGSTLLFESRAALDGYDPAGHAEVYRYDAAGFLDCLSCIPTDAPASGEASLQSVSNGQPSLEPFSGYALVANLSSDGRRAFFQSTEALVPGDTDGLQDVYEWEAQGVGSCERPEGCVYLISSGHSKRTDYLYAVSESGDDVFFRTSDLLLSEDTDETPSIYDARVGGGFARSSREPCQGEGCRPSLTPPPVLPNLGSGGGGPSGNSEPMKCGKGKHRVTRNGKSVCVKKSHKKQHRKAGSKKGGGK
jgi:hypothetical protein